MADADGWESPEERKRAFATCACLMRRIQATQDRLAAIQSLKFYHWAGYCDTYEPSELEICEFIDAMHKNPKLVPSFDPDDP